jgi:cytoskeletal protein RodZ
MIYTITKFIWAREEYIAMNDENIGERLKAVRKEAQWSLSYVAQKTMIPATRIKQIEEGNITRAGDVKLIQQLIRGR